ncbi:hypothetical protein D3C85_500360 [compost metagenome]
MPTIARGAAIRTARSATRFKVFSSFNTSRASGSTEDSGDGEGVEDSRERPPPQKTRPWRATARSGFLTRIAPEKADYRAA